MLRITRLAPPEVQLLTSGTVDDCEFRHPLVQSLSSSCKAGDTASRSSPLRHIAAMSSEIVASFAGRVGQASPPPNLVHALGFRQVLMETRLANSVNAHI